MSSANKPQWIVEKVSDMRIVDSKIEYLLKWQGYKESENTWEPEIGVDCPDLVDGFKESRKATGNTKIKVYKTIRNTNGRRTKLKLIDEVVFEFEEKKGIELNPVDERLALQEKLKDFPLPIKGFSAGLKPEKIIGATKHKHVIIYLIKWATEETADFVLGVDANERCPEIVIRFFEDRVSWN